MWWRDMSGFIQELNVVALGPRRGVIAISEKKAKMTIRLRHGEIELVPEPGDYQMHILKTGTVYHLALATEGKIVYVYPSRGCKYRIDKNARDTFTVTLRT